MSLVLAQLERIFAFARTNEFALTTVFDVVTGK